LPRIDVPFPERIVSATVNTGGSELTATSYHAPPGASWGIDKVRQAVSFSDWLSGRNGPAILGADANTPAVDGLDFEQTRTHWHTGLRRLKGGRGDDVLWGQAKVHHLRDASRVWLDDHPEELEEIRRLRPAGPLLLDRTGRSPDLVLGDRPQRMRSAARFANSSSWLGGGGAGDPSSW
jgi:hypothetical protein